LPFFAVSGLIRIDNVILLNNNVTNIKSVIEKLASYLLLKNIYSLKNQALENY